MSEIRLLLIVGRERDDQGVPFVVGAFNDEYLAQLSLEDAEAQIRRLKETWTGDPSDYEWREAHVRIQEGPLIAMFATPELTAEVEA